MPYTLDALYGHVQQATQYLPPGERGNSHRRGRVGIRLKRAGEFTRSRSSSEPGPAPQMAPRTQTSTARRATAARTHPGTPFGRVQCPMYCVERVARRSTSYLRAWTRRPRTGLMQRGSTRLLEFCPRRWRPARRDVDARVGLPGYSRRRRRACRVEPSRLRAAHRIRAGGRRADRGRFAGRPGTRNRNPTVPCTAYGPTQPTSNERTRQLWRLRRSALSTNAAGRIDAEGQALLSPDHRQVALEIVAVAVGDLDPHAATAEHLRRRGERADQGGAAAAR